jgi:hypothetical protein
MTFVAIQAPALWVLLVAGILGIIVLAASRMSHIVDE